VVKASRRFAWGGEEALLDQRAFNGKTKVDAKYLAELEGVLLSLPTELGWQRTTWTRELLGLELERRGFPRVAPCTMGPEDRSRLDAQGASARGRHSRPEQEAFRGRCTQRP